MSTEEQALHGYSLPEQRDACRARAESLGAADVLEFADEGVSGSTLQRPGLASLREVVRSGGVDVIICRDPDRLSRKLAHQLLLVEEFEKAGARLEFLDFEWKDTPEGRLFYAVKGAFSEYEREKIRERTERGRLKKAKLGGVPCGFDRYGYRYDPETGRVSVVEEEAGVVRKIFEWFTSEDIGVIGVAHRLTDLGIPTRRNASAWSRTAVRGILRSPAYKGEWAVRFNGEEAVVPVPPVVDAATWEAAQDKLARSRRLWAGGGNKRDYLLKGILTCGDCGCPMRGKSSGVRSERYFWYTCSQDRGMSRRTGCRPKKLVPAEALEGAVWEKVKAALSDPEALAREAAAQVPEEEGLRAELERAEKRMAEVERGREAVLEALAREAVSTGYPPEELLENLISACWVDKQVKLGRDGLSQVEVRLVPGDRLRAALAEQAGPLDRAVETTDTAALKTSLDTLWPALRTLLRTLRVLEETWNTLALATAPPAP